MTELDEGVVFHILGNDRRREVVTRLSMADGAVSVSELSKRIAEAEATERTSADDLYKSVYVSLQQTHLPKLASEGVIRYDPETKTIQPGPQLEDVEVYIRTPADKSRRYSVPLLLSLFGLVVIVAVVLKAPLVSQVEVGVWGIVFLVAILASLYLGESTWGAMRDRRR